MRPGPLGFPLLALTLSAIAYGWPGPFVAMQAAIIPLLGVIMLGMGLTLQAADFVAVLRRPAVIGLGLLLQFGLMPLVAWGVATGLDLAPALLAGMVLVGASPGGTASNVICYLARGDLALSVTLTTASTLLAVVATPLLTLWYAGRTVPVPTLDLLLDVLRIVILPVAAGVLLNRLAGARLALLKRALPLISVVAIVWIIAIIVALNRDNLGQVAALVVLAVILHNSLGLALGYALARLVGLPLAMARTVAIEVGMQNSGLAVALAVKHFSAMAAVPGALFSIWHNLSGAVLAAWWSRADPAESSRPTTHETSQ